MITGVFVAIAAALFPVGQLADISNSGTLFAFFMVAVAVMISARARSGPASSVPHAASSGWSAPVAIFEYACSCSSTCRTEAQIVLPIWGGIGLLCYFAVWLSHEPCRPGPDRDA
jgi:APA family basic amino acid/polyamine antiporter